VIFEEAVIVLRYNLGFHQVCGSRKKRLVSMCHVEGFRILQGGGLKGVIPPDPEKKGFISLKAGLSPQVRGDLGGETFKTRIE
jgi:hypothetical protein